MINIHGGLIEWNSSCLQLMERIEQEMCINFVQLYKINAHFLLNSLHQLKATRVQFSHELPHICNGVK